MNTITHGCVIRRSIKISKVGSVISRDLLGVQLKGGFITMLIKGGGFLDQVISLRVSVTRINYVYFQPRGVVFSRSISG